MKIGIPRALGTYEYPVLFQSFFEILGIEVVMSSKSNKEILEEGMDNSLVESCLASKIFMGHVAELVKKSKSEKIDYIFIPRLCTFDHNQTICVKFFAVYDICKNVFDANFLTLNIDYNKNSTELVSFIKLGKNLGKSKTKVIAAYLKAKRLQREYDEKKYNLQTNDINKESDNLKVLIVAHPYVSHDELLGKRITNILKKNKINIYFANINSFTMENSKILKNNINDNKNKYINISESVYWKPSKTLLNGLSSNLDNIDGIIYISVFPCGTDSLVNELAIRKIKNIPSLNLVLDEQDADVGVNTRIESFIDILNMNKEKLKKVSG